MIQFGILLPLAASGTIGALWRQYKNRRQSEWITDQPSLETDRSADQSAETLPVFDDVGELQHYQRVTWYATAFAASGSWFFPPATLISLPLLGYSTYHYLRALQESEPSERWTPLALFEIVSIGGTLIVGQLLSTSILLVFAFGTRNILLKVGNIGHHVDLSQSSFDRRSLPIWILRDGTEIKTTVGEMQEEDIFVLHPGDTVFLSGEIIEGNGVISQFSLRKEMKSLVKQAGDKVFPYTRLTAGSLQVRPT